ncbi:MAG: type IV toxin-antitoxin system AbiEi family antitoxin [bacterium]
MLEEKIFNTCIEQLRLLPLIRKVTKRQSPTVKDTRVDAFLDLLTEKGTIQLAVEIKGVLKRPLPQHLAVMKNTLNIPLLLMSEYINPSIAEDLKRNRIHFIDCQGNAFIHIQDYLYVDIQGRKLLIPREKQATTLFQPTGLQLLFVLLTNPKQLNASIRTLKNDAGISYGQAQAGMKELNEKGLLIKSKERQYKFKDKKALFERWLSHYVDRLRPKLILGVFKIAPSVEFKIPETLSLLFKNESNVFAIGGGLGADILIHYYRGPTTEIFIQPGLLERVKTGLKLIPAKDTNVTLLKLFSPRIIFKEAIQSPVVHPLLIYAELLYQGGSRALETAEMIYNMYLKQKFDEA